MSEELLRAALQLFAIVARERITDEKKRSIQEFLSLHLNREATAYYLKLFNDFSSAESAEKAAEFDPQTQQFVDDWSKIIAITRKVNQALTVEQKLVLIVKVIELVFTESTITEHQENLIHYIGQALNIPKEQIRALRLFVTGHDSKSLSDANTLIIDALPDTSVSGPHLEKKNLEGLIAVLRITDQEMCFIKYLGISVLNLNSIPLRSGKIDIFPTGSTIRGNKIEPIYYSDVLEKFLTAGRHSSITFSAEHLFYHFRNGRAALQNINIAEHGGRLIGLMGASGSGKSTLLNVLNGTEKPSGGRVMINGVDLHENLEKVRGAIGYIPQEDLLIEDLTVFENLYFAALLTSVRTEKEATKSADKVLSTLGLTEIRNLKVGNVIEKTISGGQRKRLNIGLELLREPAILFVDEPTSGLSSRDSENIMDLLKELSLRGKMVFVVIHQPSSDIFKMFDSLMIFDIGGFQIYYGNPIEAILYFRDIINAANKNQGACPECGNINPEQIFNIIETRVVNEYGRITNVRKISAGQWYQYFKQKIKIPKVKHIKDGLPPAPKIPGRASQFLTFITRDLAGKVANKQYVVINLLQAPVLAFFISYMVRYYNVLGNEDATYNFYNNQNVPVYFFMSVVVALFIGLIMSAEEIFRDRRILKREKFLNLSRTSYLTSKVSVMFALSAFQTFIFLIIGNWVLGIPLTEVRYWLILFSCSCFANMMGLNISSAFNSAVTIYILIPLLIIPQLLLSGIVISFDKFNPNVGSPAGVPLAGELMASRWAFEAYMVTQFKDNPVEKIYYESDKIAKTANYKQVYYVEALSTHLAYAINHYTSRHDEKYTQTLKLLHDEIGYELADLEESKLPEVSKLNPEEFDSTVYLKTYQFLNVLKQYYVNREAEAIKEKEAKLAPLTATPEAAQLFSLIKSSYQNQAVTDAVENLTTPNRIVEYKGELIQKIYPVYDDSHHPGNFFDFTARLYQPVKYFAGSTIDTLYFNMGVIWVMTLLLYITLYFDVFKKLVSLFENRKHYRLRLIKE